MVIEWTGPTVSLGDIDLLDYLIQHGWSCSPVASAPLGWMCLPPGVDAIAVLRTLNSDLGVIVDRVLKRVAPAIPPVRAEEPPQIPEESATGTNAQ